MPRSQAVETMLAYFSTVEDAGNAVSTIIARGVIPAAMEMMDGLTLNAVEDAQNMGLMREAAALLIVELDGPRTGIFVQRQIVESCLQPNNVKSFRWANDATERAKIWKARKSAFGGYGRIAPHAYVLDGVIPRSKLAEAITKIAAIGEKHVLIIGNVYHAGDGNLHPCLLFHRDNLDEVKRVMIAASEILEMCVDLGGTLSGEHGVGIEKVAEMAKLFTSEDLEAMRWIKSAFNSSGHLNPGKLLPTVKSCGESGMRPLLRFQIIGAC
jgi:glycolate oxidase